jgi:hypothetical protein
LVAETVRNRVKAEESKNSGATDEARAAINRARLQTMERRVQELEQENAFLKNRGPICERTTVSEKRELILAEKATFEVTVLCRLLGVSKSGYYDWESRPMSAAAQRREDLKPLIESVFMESGRTDGYSRVHAELRRVH